MALDPAVLSNKNSQFTQPISPTDNIAHEIGAMI
jgi:hypothetical protein